MARRTTTTAALGAFLALPLVAACTPKEIARWHAAGGAAEAEAEAAHTVWDDLAECESGGDWAIDTGNGYYGGLQFSGGTWRAYGGDEYAGTADDATRDEQIVIAERVLDEQGWDAWPSCSRQLGLR